MRQREAHPRFFLGLRDTAGYMSRLANGLREMGFPTTCADLSGHPFGYEAAGWWTSVAGFLGKRRRDSSGLRRAFWESQLWILTGSVVVWALRRHDVFVISALPAAAALPTTVLLRLAGKRLIVVFHGSDSRPPYLDGFQPVTRSGDTGALKRATARQRRAVRSMERWAHVVVCNTASSHFLTRPFVPFLLMGIAAPEQREPSPVSQSDVTRVVHAPSDPIGKGTAEVRNAVAELQAEGLHIELIELSGVPHSQVLDELARADLVVDQVFSDLAIPGLATEASSMAKPVVIGGYDWQLLRREIPASAWPPTVQVHPRGIKSAIRDLATDPKLRIAAGLKAKEFVDRRFRPTQVATRFLELARADPPPEMLFNPSDIAAMHGCGLSRDHGRELIDSLVRRHGVSALGLADKPHLERRVLLGQVDNQERDE